MKTVFSMMFMLATLSSAHAGGTEIAGGIPKLPDFNLEGKTYCRTIISDGSFGQPRGERKHCLSFKDGVATDYANTFFGNPPEFAAYKISAFRVSFGDSIYEISMDEKQLYTIKGSAVEGTIFELEGAESL